MADIESAIYVDFDNIYTCLSKCYSSVVAENFVTYISKWVDYFTLTGMRHGSRRVFRKKIVYCNPCVYSRQRSVFVRSGFRAVDCPPLTAHEKTATDMYMTVDIISDLYCHDYQDFVILSGDADFTPTLFHINELSRNSILLGIGKVSPIYSAIANIFVREQDFVSVFENLPPYYNTPCDGTAESVDGSTTTATTVVPNRGSSIERTTIPNAGNNTPLVRIIKRGGEDNVNSAAATSTEREKPLDSNKQQSSSPPSTVAAIDNNSGNSSSQAATVKGSSETPTQQTQETPKKETKKVITLNSFSDLSKALKLQEEEAKNNTKTPTQSTTQPVQTVTGTDEVVPTKVITFQSFGLPNLSFNVRRYIFEQSLSYVNNRKSPNHYVRSICKKVQNQFPDVRKEDVKKYLDYIPYDSLTLETSARQVFVTRLCKEQSTLLTSLAATHEDVEQLLAS